MKKIIIIAAIILTSAVTAWSVSKQANKTDVTKIEKSDFAGTNVQTTGTSLSTAD